MLTIKDQIAKINNTTDSLMDCVEYLSKSFFINEKESVTVIISNCNIYFSFFNLLKSIFKDSSSAFWFVKLSICFVIELATLTTL